ncbi:MAG: hypothetical protein AUH75_12440 [Gemmatimonadetes bacterium 13_1_40CM_4_65_7]|nr:MAG: hypothetical protein AUH75_12440 [Gemmatimonadetes bacterium 13_1_40CM_4_65_7]
MKETPTGRWLLLFHQIPPKPDYFRVKVWRRLQRIGAVPVKNSVWVLPYNDQAVEDFRWLLEEIEAGGGEGSVCRGDFVDGLSDRDVEALFRKARTADYAAIARDAKSLTRKAAPVDVARLDHRLAEVTAIDYFHAPNRQKAGRVLAHLEARLRRTELPEHRGARAGRRAGRMRGRTWVTRRGVFVDRIASAWLIKRFIDPAARFKVVAPEGYSPRKNELRFDMFEAEYTHEGDRCTFETLLRRFRLRDPALRAIGEIVHDIDCKDAKFGRAEATGVERLLAGIARRHATDATRLRLGAAVFDNLYQSSR